MGAPRRTPRQTWPPAWARWAAIRCVAALALRRGYIHPDEWFQSCEPAAQALRLFPALRHAPLAWEFTAEAPARSALVPALSCGVPLAILRLLRSAAPAAVVAAPRLWLALLAGAGQGAAQRGAGACGVSQVEASRAGVAFAATWPALVLLPRPLSNSLEALALAATLHLALPPAKQAPSRFALAAMGLVAAIGAFCRFTFPLFAAPLHLIAAWRAAAAAAGAARPRAAAGAAARAAAAAAVLYIALGFAIGAAACAAIDAAYYGRPVLTPLNSLRYNAQAANLAQHGLHPRALHAIVNAPMLFAPLLPPAIAATVAALRTLSRAPSAASRVPLQPPSAAATAVALACCVVLPLAALSAAPHQEPRFLLPMLLPLASLGGAAALASRRRIIAFAAFNAALALFWGCAHQAGVVPAAAAASQLAARWPGSAVASSTTAMSGALAALHASPLAPRGCALGEAPRCEVLFWRTYPPPASLLPGCRVIDLSHTPAHALAAAVTRSGRGSAHVAADCERCALRLLIAPALAPPPDALAAGAAVRLAVFTPHFSGEDVGDAFAALMKGAPLRDALGLALHALSISHSC